MIFVQTRLVFKSIVMEIAHLTVPKLVLPTVQMSAPLNVHCHVQSFVQIQPAPELIFQQSLNSALFTTFALQDHILLFLLAHYTMAMHLTSISMSMLYIAVSITTMTWYIIPTSHSTATLLESLLVLQLPNRPQFSLHRPVSLSQTHGPLQLSPLILKMLASGSATGIGKDAHLVFAEAMMN